MDNFLLTAVVRELAAEITGLRLDSVRETPSGEILLRFDDPRGTAGPGRRRGRSLLVASSSAGGKLHPVRRRVDTLRGPLSGFAAQLKRHLAGRRLAGVAKAPSERLVELIFEGEGGPVGGSEDRDASAGGKKLVAEMIGRASNLLVLDGEGRIAAFARSPASEFRRPEPGRPYVPPPRPAGARDGVFEATAGCVRSIAREAAGEGRPLARALLDGLVGLSRPVAAEVERLAARGVDPAAALARWTGAIGRGEIDAVLYSPGDPARLPRDRVHSEDRLFALPLPLEQAPAGLVATRAGSAGEAAGELERLRAAARALVSRRTGLAAILGKERKKLARLRANLESDLRAVPPPGRSRREAEALLAGLATARREGDRAIVADPYEGQGVEMSVRIDPALSLQENAEALFRRERKAERAKEAIADRLAATLRRAGRLDALAERLAAAADPDALADAERRMLGEGFVLEPDRPVRRTGRQRRGEPAAPGGPPRRAGVRRVVSGDGLEILVGRTGRDNDRLTFRIASPDDFWLHAVDAAGAHVVVRNPARLAHLPQRTLIEAAGIAAHFSRAAGSGRVEVHVTRCKHVRKARGAPPGTVLVRKFTSLRVVPRAPAGEGETTPKDPQRVD